jgi:hypothetical protein
MLAAGLRVSVSPDRLDSAAGLLLLALGASQLV